MRRLFNYSIFFIISCILNSCSETQLDEPIESEHYYKLVGKYHNEYINAVKQDNNNGLVICGYTQDELNISAAYISKTSALGMVEWDTVFTENLLSKAHDVVTIPNQNQIIVAFAQRYSTDSSNIYLMRFSSEGVFQDSIGTKALATEVKNVQIIYQNDGDIVLVAQVDRTDTDSEETFGFLVSYLLTDELILEKQEPEIELNEQVEGQIVVEYYNEQKYFLAATVYESEKTESNSPSTGIRILLINNNVVEWSILFGEEGVNESCNDLMLESNKLIVAGNYKNSDELYQKIYLSNISMNGKELNNYKIEVDDYEGDISSTSFTLNLEDNFVFTGDIATGTGTKDVLFLETTREGQNINFKSYGSNGATAGESTGRFISFLELENDYLLAGEIETINNFDICLFRLDDTGEWITRK